MDRREAGRRGGMVTLERHGREHMRAIGRAGFAGLVRKLGYAGGGRRGALWLLSRRGKIRPRTPDLTAAELSGLYAAVGLAGQEPAF